MKFEKLIVILPFQSLEGYTLDREVERADELLSAWTALYHPALLACAGELPRWVSAQEPPKDPSGSLVMLPGASEKALAPAWLDLAATHPQFRRRGAQSALLRRRILDALEMIRIARGIDEAQLSREPSILSVVNTSSPLRLDGPMIEGTIELSRRNQPVAVTPFTLSGAMAPATIAGALAQQNAEALATVALMQLVNPGAPAIYGAFTSNVDMKSGAPAFGTTIPPSAWIGSTSNATVFSVMAASRACGSR